MWARRRQYDVPGNFSWGFLGIRLPLWNLDRPTVCSPCGVRMSYESYNVIHVVGVIILFSALGALAATAGAAGGPLRRVALIAHGVALAVIFVAGFGLLARLGHFGDIPNWAYLKMVLWGVLGLAVVPLRRKPEWAPAVWLLMPVVGGIAVWLAVTQPL